MSSNYTHKIKELVASNPLQMSYEEYSYIADCILRRAPCNVLVFGVGNDSAMWREINTGGLTTFIENDNEWIEKITNNSPDIDIVKCSYTTKLLEADSLLQQHKNGERVLLLELPERVRRIAWDIIVIDAPFGGTIEAPGRMQSIFEAYQLSQHGGTVDIFIHDINRPVEKMYADYFFGVATIQAQFSRLRHVRISSTSNNSSVS